MLMFSSELLVIVGLLCTIQSTPCEHWTTVRKNSFYATANETGVCQINNGGTHTLVDSDILYKNTFFDLQKSMEKKPESLFEFFIFFIRKRN